MYAEIERLVEDTDSDTQVKHWAKCATVQLSGGKKNLKGEKKGYFGWLIAALWAWNRANKSETSQTHSCSWFNFTAVHLYAHYTPNTQHKPQQNMAKSTFSVVPLYVSWSCEASPEAVYLTTFRNIWVIFWLCIFYAWSSTVTNWI